MVTNTSHEQALATLHRSLIWARLGKLRILLRLSGSTLVGVVLVCESLRGGESVLLPPRQSDDERFVDAQRKHFSTEAYRKAAVEVLLARVNEVAHNLRLRETLPVRESDLAGAFIQPPFWSDAAGWFGSVSTGNYHYFASQANKLSYVERNFGGGEAAQAFLRSLRERYGRQREQMNTNAAYALAIEWLEAVGVDTKALERDSRVRISVPVFGATYVPSYTIIWSQPCAAFETVSEPSMDKSDSQLVASVHLLEPERLLLRLRVEKPQYIRGKALSVPNRDELLQRTDNAKMREVWFTTQAYREAALEVMTREIEQVSRQMGLAEELPITATNLLRVHIETPFIMDHFGRFGQIFTRNYVYGASHAGKLGTVIRYFRFPDEPTWLKLVKQRYAVPKTQVKTRRAYLMATQWLAAASVDVAALERDYKVRIEPWDLKQQFVPLYRLRWMQGDEVAVTMEVLEPERLLKVLMIEKPEYINRPPLSVPERDKLLQAPTK